MKGIYHAVSYSRVSKEDTGTIENQQELIRDFVKKSPDIHIISEKKDIGFSGSDFARPAFSEILKDMELGKFDCLIVKDLSRLGRNYIDVGELINIIFPRFKIRLIAVNDSVIIGLS